jgi:hypothetical protein
MRESPLAWILVFKRRKKSKRAGTVVKCVGKNTWLVNFGGSKPE